MKVSKSQPRILTNPTATAPLRSVSLQIREYQVTLKVKTAVPLSKPQLSR